MIRRALAPGAAALAVALGAGYALGGADAAASAGIGIVLVLVNFVLHGLSLAWAAGISLTVLGGVALGGFVVRLGAILAVLFALDAQPFFSPLAFGLAALPATGLLLVYEMRFLAREMGRMWIPREGAAR